MKYEYEIVNTGMYPSFKKDSREVFKNPVFIGEKVKLSGSGSELLLVESVEHYPEVSVLYVKSTA